MTNYSDIRGYRVKYLSSDPTLNTSTEGQVWYNSTSGTLKALVKLAAWSSNAPMITGRFNAGTFGNSDAVVIASGAPSVPSPVVTVEEYNGSGWSSASSVTNKRTNIGSNVGLQTSGLIFGGIDGSVPSYSNSTEEYDGSTWTAGGSYPSSSRSQGGAGTQTAGLGFGGFNPSYRNDTNEYNGSTWTASNNLTVASQFSPSSTGLQTAAIYAGSNESPGNNGTAAIYDGTSWTAVSSLNNSSLFMGMSGTQTSALVFAENGNTRSEKWDGTTWSANAATANTAYRSAGSGNNSDGGLFQQGSSTPGGTASTANEQYNNSINTITPGAWASGPSVNTARQSGGTANLSPQTANIIFTGYTAPPTATGNVGNTEEYDGSAWTTVNPVNTGRRAVSGGGTQTSALLAGGYSEPAGNIQNKTEEYDGTSWTVAPTLNTARYTHGGAGSQAAAWVAGNTPATQSTETYNGTAWTSTNNLIDAREASVGDGTNTAGIIFGTGTTPDADQKKTEHWDGTSWSAGGTLNIGIRNSHANGGSSAQTAALKIGGVQTPGTNVIASVEEYDGTVWRTQASLANATQVADGGGTTSAGMCAAGADTASVSRTEEFTPETQTATASTLTTS